MSSGVTRDVWESPKRAVYYRALADAFSLTPRPFAPLFEVLQAMPCEDVFVPSGADGVEAEVAAWIARGETPALHEVLTGLFGPGFCSHELPTVPACAAFYVEDAQRIRDILLAAYAECGYVESAVFTPQCEGVGYVARQLAFAAHCVECRPAGSPEVRSAARTLRDTMFEWMPLFARALVMSRAHPAVVFLGLRLQCLLDHERQLQS